MSDISQIKVGGTSYNIKDTTARNKVPTKIGDSVGYIEINNNNDCISINVSDTYLDLTESKLQKLINLLN